MAKKEVISSIETRVERLIDDHRKLVLSCETLRSERDQLKAENRDLQSRIKALDSELSLMQLSEGLGGDSRNKTKAKARVNRLVREVDKCIALLNTKQVE